VIRNYGHKVVGEVIRQARIGLGDVDRAKGDYAAAEKAYAAAGIGKSVRDRIAPIARGDFARQVEDFTHRNELEAAAEALDAWADAFPSDKLEGYWSLLAARLSMARDDHAAAAREAETLVRVHPASNYAAQLLQLAWRAYGHLRRKDKAEETLRRIVAEYPESPLAEWASGELKKR
jgi:tetratricopeptide (TPR) repeat protein